MRILGRLNQTNQLDDIKRKDLLFSTLLRGHTHLNLVVKPARSSQRGIQRIRPVRRADDDDGLFARREIVHTCQELSHDTALHFPLGVFTFGRDGVDFVQEEDTWRDFLRGRVSSAGQGTHSAYLGFVKGVSQSLFRLARHAGHYGGCGHGDEGQLQLLHCAVSVSVRGAGMGRLTPARHLTSCVLPPPGTPWSRTPFGRGTPVWR